MLVLAYMWSSTQDDKLKSKLRVARCPRVADAEQKNSSLIFTYQILISYRAISTQILVPQPRL